MSKYITVWEKSKNPYATIDEEQLNEEKEYNDDYFPHHEDKGHFDVNIQEDEDKITPMKGIHGLLTDAGFIPLTEYTDTHKLFNFWTGHTNYGITQGVASEIEETPGVELLHVFTRYRFRIAVARLFKAGVVCHDISNRIRKYLENKQSA